MMPSFHPRRSWFNLQDVQTWHIATKSSLLLRLYQVAVIVKCNVSNMATTNSYKLFCIKEYQESLGFVNMC